MFCAVSMRPSEGLLSFHDNIYVGHGWQFFAVHGGSFQGGCRVAAPLSHRAGVDAFTIWANGWFAILVHPGFHTTAREPKRVHLRVPAFKNTTKIQREDTQRGKKRTNFAAGEGKKERNCGRSRGREVQRKGGPNQTLKPTPTHETPLLP